MDLREKIALRQAIALLSICLVLAVICLGTSTAARGFEMWALVAGGALWASIGIVAWLVLLSPHGWFGSLGVWIDRFMQDDWPQGPDNLN